LVRDSSGSLRAATLTERRADYDALPLAWASQEYDPDTGLTHYHFREYSPSLGGWLTRDPIGLAGGYLNLRSYLGNRPADALDVWGEGAPDVFHPSMPTTAAVKAEREDLRKKLQKVDEVIDRAAPKSKRGWFLPSGPYMPPPEFITPDQTECNESYGDYLRALAYRAYLARLIRILDRVIDVREAEYGKLYERGRLRDATSGMAEFTEVYNAYLLPEDGHEMKTDGLWASAELLESAGKAEFTAIEILAFGGATTLERLIAGEGAAVVRPTASAALEAGAAAKSEVTVYRVFGGDARAQGYSWTTKDPRTISGFRDVAGLPSGGESGANNTAEFLIKGRTSLSSVIESRPALPLDGNKGGLLEYIINPKDVTVTDFSVLKP
jgi:RHS repeat-associated protein